MPAISSFEDAADAVVNGDIATLRSLLDDPRLIRARSAREHHATLLHYVAANGVEDERQRTPANAVEVAKTLLEAGAEPDALADMYGEQCTTLSMLVSSVHPAEAGVQVALAETLLDYGAALEGPGTKWQSAVLTALIFGYRETAEMLARRGAPLNLAALAGLGRVDEVARLLSEAGAEERHAALALAAQHGQVEVVRLFLDRGEDPDRYNPADYHAHATPLHQAVWANQGEVVRLLVERGARLDLRDTLYSGTPLEWAVHGERTAIAEYLRGRGASDT
jgi:ankyrin repeat protein